MDISMNTIHPILAFLIGFAFYEIFMFFLAYYIAIEYQEFGDSFEDHILIVIFWPIVLIYKLIKIIIRKILRR